MAAASEPNAKAAVTAPVLRPMTGTNWSGLWAHYKRCILVFFQFLALELGGPVVTSLLFLAVFSLALGGAGEWQPGITITQFIAPGIVMFMVTHQGFQHAAFMILEDKIEGTVADMLMAPLSALEILAGYVLAAATTALMVGLVLSVLMALLVGLPLAHLWAVALYGLAGALLFALIGTLAGLWAERWEHYSAAETFLILPLGVMSGAFFGLEALAEEARWIVLLNPVYYVIDGFRWGFLDRAAAELPLGLAFLGLLTAALWMVNWRLIAVGYKLKP
ncbi:MAG: ABC transporter permease [Kiloniellales bacterium]|nr:ABC transporter permease [Kiloniellales bacterium]